MTLRKDLERLERIPLADPADDEETGFAGGEGGWHSYLLCTVEFSLP